MSAQSFLNDNIHMASFHLILWNISKKRESKPEVKIVSYANSLNRIVHFHWEDRWYNTWPGETGQSVYDCVKCCSVACFSVCFLEINNEVLLALLIDGSPSHWHKIVNRLIIIFFGGKTMQSAFRTSSVRKSVS